MESRLQFREVGVVHCRTAGDRARAVAWPLVAIAALIGVMALAGYWDQRAEQEQALADARRDVALQRAYGQGLRQGQADMLATAEAGWTAAHQAAADAQACLPVRVRP